MQPPLAFKCCFPSAQIEAPVVLLRATKWEDAALSKSSGGNKRNQSPLQVIS